MKLALTLVALAAAATLVENVTLERKRFNRPQVKFESRSNSKVNTVPAQATTVDNTGRGRQFDRSAIESRPQDSNDGGGGGAPATKHRVPLRDAVEGSSRVRENFHRLHVKQAVPATSSVRKRRDDRFYLIPIPSLSQQTYHYDDVDDDDAQAFLDEQHRHQLYRDHQWQIDHFNTLYDDDVDEDCALEPARGIPHDCSAFEICLHGVWTLQHCPEGLEWNLMAARCDWPESAQCIEQPPPPPPIVIVQQPPPPPTTTTTTTTTTTAQPPSSPDATTSTPVETPAPTTSVPATNAPSSSKYKVICYYTNWSWYRQGQGKFSPSNIDLDLCTHIIYGFATLDPNNLIMKVFDNWCDTDEYGPKLYDQITALKKKGVQVLIALGGWNDSLGSKYSRMVNDPAARKRFVDNAIAFIDKFGFQGLDLDWEYPKCWQVDCKKGPDSDKQGFAALVSELRQAFNPRGWLLSAAVSPSKTVIDAGYDVPSISRDLDWIGVMTYDYHGHWDKRTGHVAPLHLHSEADVAYFNTNYTLNYWIRLGADPKKIIMGLPLYGQSFTLMDSKINGLNAPTYGPGEAGQFTRQGGFMSYYEICKDVASAGWTVVQDSEGAIGPYAYKGNNWVSFDDAAMIRRKSQMVRDMDIGGAMIWALDLDDFQNRCGCETYPLLKTINRVLRDYPSAQSDCQIQTSTALATTSDVGDYVRINECQENSMKAHEADCTSYYHCIFNQWQAFSCPDGLAWNQDHCDWPYNTDCDANNGTVYVPSGGSQTGEVQTGGSETGEWATGESQSGQWVTEKPWMPPTPAPTPSPYPEVSMPDTGYKVVCYFTNWAWYRPGIGKYIPEDIDPAMCTHIIYGFSVLDYTELVLKPHDGWADIDNRFFERVVAFKQKGVKVSVGLGGWNDSQGDKYSRLVNSPSARSRFTQRVIAFIEKYGFDGLDLDWEYPKCWQVNCKAGPDSDKAGFTAWVRELSAEFKPRGWLLSAAVSPSNTVIDAAYDVAQISKDLDFINVMTYDYFGNWDKETGHVAPMYAHSEVDNVFFNVNYTINYWIRLGADPAKLIMGMPMYGQAFTLVNAADNGLNAKASGPGTPGEFTRQGGFLAYYEICERIKDKGWTVVQDPESAMGPYAYKGNQWASFDDVGVIRRKSELVKSMNLGGAMIWALDLDDFRNRCGCERHPLLRTINRVLREYPIPEPDCSASGKSL